jgi:hypothetical protein
MLRSVNLTRAKIKKSPEKSSFDQISLDETLLKV